MTEILTGALEHLSLPALLQLLENEAITGRLKLGDAGEIQVADGNIVGALWKDEEGYVALMQLFFVTEGPFAVEVGEVLSTTLRHQQPMGSNTGLIMSALRLVDEWVRLAPMVLAPEPATTWSDAELDPLLPMLDGHRTLAEATLHAGLVPCAVIEAVLDALDGRALRSVAPPDPERAAAALNPPDPSEFYDLIDQGRQHLRARELSEAEACFRRALMARPDESLARQNLRRVLQLREREGP
ncbi:MAG: DUF4388 domain-containing protein [Alphaproteobacteria bacterium]|nr:DUF4388 domain-containing protein [Alphaproteobacteria bacterium]